MLATIAREPRLRGALTTFALLLCAWPSRAGDTYYRSIGTAGPYSAGSVSAKDGFVLVVGAGTAWESANRGRGDRIFIDSTDYTVSEVLSETRLLLTEPFSGTSGAGKAYQIHRKFPNPYDWIDCINATDTTPVGCHDVATSSLVADDRSEVAIFYKDSRVMLSSGIFDVSGATTDAGHTITLTADGGNRHHGRQGTGVVLDRSSFGAVLDIGVDFITVEWLELTDCSEYIIRLNGINDDSDIVLRNLILHDSNEESIFLSSGGRADLTIYNNFIFNTQDNGIQINDSLNNGARINIYNNTLFDNGNKGIVATNGSPAAPVIILQNNIAVGNAGPSFDISGSLLSSTSSNNIADDSTGTSHSPAGGGQDNVAPGPAGVDFLNIGSGSEDLHINPANAGSKARDSGIPLAGIVDEDIDESPRELPWDVGADEISAQPVQVFTATSQDDQVTLEWVAPDVGPYSSTLVVRSTVAPPLTPGAGSPVACPTPPLGGKGLCVDLLATNGITYYYGAFVDADGVNGIISQARTAKAMPIDPTFPEKKRWSYTTGATIMEPPGLGSFKTPPWTVHASSNDDEFHSMQSGPSGGKWPVGFRPAKIGSPAQHRSTVLPVSMAPFALQLGYLATQSDGVFAIDGDTGDRIWQNESFSMLSPAVTAVLTELGAPVPFDFVFVGTRAGGGADKLYALNVGSGTVAARFDNSGAQSGDNAPIGEIGGMSVVYPGAFPDPRVVFSSRDGGGGQTLWNVRFYEVGPGVYDFELLWATDIGGGIDTSPIVRGDTVYVGAKDQNIYARQLLDGVPKWTYTPTFDLACVGAPAGDGEVKSFLFPVGANTLVFATNTRVWSVDDLGANACVTAGWPVSVTGPSTPLYVPGTSDVLVGSSDGNLYQIPITGGGATPFAALGAPVGAPTYDMTNNFIYVGASDGIVYAVTYP